MGKHRSTWSTITEVQHFKTAEAVLHQIHKLIMTLAQQT